ncbi:sugar ABC transporter solute-binding protein, partial [mine drainage metagenome]
MNSWALYYNKSIMKAAGIASPPKTLAQLLADSKKEWKVSGNKLEQIGFYPNGGFENFSSFFNAVNCFNAAGKYDFANCKGAQVEAKFFASYANEPYALFNSLSTAYGAVAGGDDDPFVAGKQGFTMDGPWEGAQNIPVTNPAMEHNFG